MRMSEPNFDAYKTHITQKPPVEAVTITDGGQRGTRDDYITVDFDKFRSLLSKEADRLTDKFIKAASDGRISKNVLADFESDFRENVALARSLDPALEGTSGGVVYKKSHIMMIDSWADSFIERAEGVLGGRNISENSANDERLNRQYLREHEVAHQMLGLDEAGADYMAAARLLQTSPGPKTEDFLQRMADLKTVSPYLSDNQRSDRLSKTYGYGCGEAIMAALGDEKNIRNISVEEMYDNAQMYDLKNTDYRSVKVDGNLVRPEIIIREDIKKINPDIQTYKPGDFVKAGQQILDSKAYPIGTPQHEALENAVEAFQRIDKAVTEMPPLVPVKSAPALQPTIQP